MMFICLNLKLLFASDLNNLRIFLIYRKDILKRNMTKDKTT